MYFYKNGKKVKHENENFNPATRGNYDMEKDEEKDDDNDVGKCPIWVFVILGIIALLVMIWLIICIIKDKKSKNSSSLNF